jgi:hemoglobin/transferrin/lactoferrin receptor protein
MTFLRSVAFVAILSFAQPGLASGGDVHGLVRDSSGAVVEGAVVAILTAQRSVVATVGTSADGSFTATGLLPGRYLLVITAGGFAESQRPIDIGESGAPPIEVTLEVGALQEEVTVTATADDIEDRLKAAQAVNVIDADEIARRVKTVVAQAVAEEAGITLQRTSPTIAGVFVRGLTGTKVNVYVDGVRFTTGAQRGGINTFLDLVEPTSLDGIEVLRGPSSAQYGSDALGGSVQFLSRVPALTGGGTRLGGVFSMGGGSAHENMGASLLGSLSTRRVGLLVNLAGRHAGEIRPGAGIDSHAAATRFLGVGSDRLMPGRLPDTGSEQHGGTIKLNWMPGANTQLVANYSRSLQQHGDRYDQLLGGDGNLIAELNGLTLDFFYARLERFELGWFDRASVTYSVNSQREERVNQGGNGNPRATIGHEPERTTAHGVQASVSRQLTPRQTLLIGGDLYFEGLASRAFNVSPVSGGITPRRPRVPDGSTFNSGGVYAQTTLDLLGDHVRFVGNLRMSASHYEASAADSPLVNGQPLWPDDELRASDATFRAGVVVSPKDPWAFTFSVSRGFRAPNMTDLGTLGLTGSGFEVAAPDVADLGATVGSTAGATAVSTGDPVVQVGSETSLQYDVGARYRSRFLSAEVSLFVNNIRGNIQKQALILPQGAVGLSLGGQIITQQLANGVVFVPAATNPVLVRTNFDNARIWGVEYRGDVKLHPTLTLNTLFTYVRAKDTTTDLPPNIEGGTPAPEGYVLLQYAPTGARWRVQPYLHAAGRQPHLSSLDLEDRRTGAGRSRASIRSFFFNGATARGWVGPGADGVPGTTDDVLTVTGETLAQVQDRVLGPGVNSSSLFTAVSGYVTFGIRGGIRLGRHEILFDAENLGDENYRGISWGVDAPGRGVTVHYIARF